MSHLMLKTQKHVTAEAELPSHRLLLRAGLARQLASGIYSLTPLAHRAIRHIERIVREEMERIGGQELLLPVTAPAELWRESGRYDAIGSDLARFNDRNDHAMVLSMTHEESVTDLARSVISSYRQLPQMVFQIQTKFRDEPRPRGGLIRLREFLMKDAYSFHATQEDFDSFYERIREAYRTVFRRVGVPVLVVEADSGIMGGNVAHEFMLLASGGEDTLIVCGHCGYAANQEIAVAAKGAGRTTTDDPLEEIFTPGATTIAALCEAAGCTPDQTLKAVFYTTGEELILALIRGDLDVADIKLRNLLHAEVRALSPQEAKEAGLAAGYTGPAGLQLDVPLRIVADDLVPNAGSLIAGANRTDYHLRGVRFGRDFIVDLVGDIALARSGDTCACCGGTLEARRGIEMGNTFKPGTRYSAEMGATFADEEGASHPLLLGSYGIGITRLLACVIEQHHDEDGICWPDGIAPYRHHLVVLGSDEAPAAGAESIYTALGADNTLYDDRELSAGIKLKDADLLGMPLRITVGTRSLATGGAEVRLRATGETRIVPLAQVSHVAAEMLAATS
jgi:prolyl-tRNA synthetase